MTYRIEIQPDEFAESPREWDNLGIFALFRRGHDLPNESTLDYRDFDSWEEIQRHVIREFDSVVCLPIYGRQDGGIMLDHSFDLPYMDSSYSAQLGFIYTTRERVIAEYGDDSAESIDKACSVLEGEVGIYNQYLNGDVWQFIIYDENDEVVDSCGGFYDYSECENEGNLSLASINQEEEKKQKRVDFMMNRPCPFIDQSPALSLL